MRHGRKDHPLEKKKKKPILKDKNPGFKWSRRALQSFKIKVSHVIQPFLNPFLNRSLRTKRIEGYCAVKAERASSEPL